MAQFNQYPIPNLPLSGSEKLMLSQQQGEKDVTVTASLLDLPGIAIPSFTGAGEALEPGATPTVDVTGDDVKNLTLTIGVPAGAPGDKGDPGPAGADGAQGGTGPAGPPGAAGQNSTAGTSKGFYNAATNTPTLSANGGGGSVGDTYTIGNGGAGTMTIDDVGALAVGNRIQCVNVSTGVNQWQSILTPQGAQTFSAVSSQLVTVNTITFTVGGPKALSADDGQGNISTAWEYDGSFTISYANILGGVGTLGLLYGSTFGGLTIFSSPAYAIAFGDPQGNVGFGLRWDGTLDGEGGSSGGGGSSVPLPTYFKDPNQSGFVPPNFAILRGVKRWRMLYIGGQSLDVGFNPNSSDNPIIPNALYPDNVFMFNNINGGSPRVNGTPATGIVPAHDVLTDFATLNARGERGVAIGTQVASMLAGLTVPDNDQYFVIANGAVSGQSVQNLGRGTQQYISYLQVLQDFKRLGAAALYDEMILDGIFIDQGQANTSLVNSVPLSFGFAKEDFARNWENHLWKMFEDARRILNNPRDPKVYITKDSQVAVQGSVTSPFNDPILEAWELLRERASGYIRIVGSDWVAQRQQPVVTFGPGAEHCSSYGCYQLGVDAGVAYAAEEFGEGWSHMRPTDAWWSGASQLTVRFYVPFGGVPILDTTETVIGLTPNSTTGVAAIAGFYGLFFNDRSSSPPAIVSCSLVPNVAPTASNFACDVVFNLATPPAQYYSCQFAGGTVRSTPGADGPNAGARLPFRGSIGYPSVAEPGVTRYPFCASFIMPIATA
ncbi:hypothetical protein ACELLULO517_07815 [Acidisoma cellulosilytica]|uniref:Uncharacterized protein n=1 Tax=Acidisoma cellulosilyticum TaxID=2802395 RepID=A0A963YZQ4_9PROT|nr:hypothetical protein [Acidisoma cellulosilyticum]MCB8880138.1 hypothetical protein [Acidisoma cellulosilyticum]